MQPNIIIINPDQMRADSLHHLGNEAAYTPNLDLLANEGVSFSNAFCQNPVCVPSRCSFMTGLYPHTNGHRTMSYLLRRGEDNLFLDMKLAGYKTYSSTRGDLMAGQDAKYHRECIDKYIVTRRKRGQKGKLPPSKRGEPNSDTYYSFMNGIIEGEGNVPNMDDFTVNGTIDCIKHRHNDKPFFMFVGLMAPHPEYQIERKYYDLIDKSKLQSRIPNLTSEDGKPSMEHGLAEKLRVQGWEEERLADIRAVYLGMCAKVDDQVGRIVATLKDEGIYDDTVIIVLSDHGDYTGDYGLVEKSQNCFPDCLVNVPFIIKPQSGLVVERGVHDQLVELTDLCATCFDLAGVQSKRVQFGKSVVPSMTDKAAPHRDVVFCEGGRLLGEKHCMEYNEKYFTPKNLYSPRMELQAREDGTHTRAVMVRTGKYKYVKRLYEKSEFYDLSLGERVNLIDDEKYADIVAQLDRRLSDWYLETCDSVPYDFDERFNHEFIVNAAIAYGVPRFLRLPMLGILKLIRFRISKYIR